MNSISAAQYACSVVDLPEVSDADDKVPLLAEVSFCEQMLGWCGTAERAYQQQVLEKKESRIGSEEYRPADDHDQYSTGTI
jgi:hypothetical protein